MRNLKKVYRTALTEDRPWKQAVYAYLHNYRATPHSTTGIAPATLLFQYNYRTRLPQTVVIKPANDKEVRRKDAKEKERMKRNAEQHKSLRKTKFKVGDVVLVKRSGIIPNATTPYQTQPYEIIVIKGTMITARRNTETITRNASFFKLLKHFNKNAVHQYAASRPDHYDDIAAPDNQVAAPAPPAHMPAQVPARRNPPRNRQRPAHLQDFVVGCA